MRLAGPAVLALMAALFLVAPTACRRRAEPVVVVYTALDRIFSEPILDEFEARTGIRVLAKYDMEATKTVGLVNAIRSERRRPRCDVFWNNEIVNTVRLKQEGLLEAYRPRAAADYPAEFRDADGHWSGFAARARVLIVNTNLVPPAEMPDSIFDLTAPRWRGQASIAKPLFGTMATHVACLFTVLGEQEAAALLQAMKSNRVRIESGNKAVALNVAAGRVAFGLTDTDDAIAEIEDGKPVAIVYPDSRADQLGVLFIPNTLALVRGAPHAEAGRRLIEYLLSPEVETRLALARSAQIPLNPRVNVNPRVKRPTDVKAMPVDFASAAEAFAQAAAYVQEHFLE